MNYRAEVEKKILYILLTYNRELISDQTTANAFDIIRKHSVEFGDFSVKQHQDVFKAILNQMHDGLTAINPVQLVEYRPQEYKTFEQQANEFLSIIVNLKNTAFAPYSELDQLFYKLKEFVLADFWRWSSQTGMSTNFEAINVIQYGENMMGKYQSIYNRVTNGIIQQDMGSDDMKEVLRQKMKLADQGLIGGIPIHIKSVQSYLKGLNAPDFIIIGGRPSMGKTEVGLSIAWESAQQFKHVFYSSIEMSEMQLVNKIVSSLTGIELDRIKNGQLTIPEFNTIAHYYDQIKKSTFMISDKHRVLEKLIQKLRDLHRQGKLDLVVIDYIQLMKTLEKIQSRDQYIGYISGELKALALELGIPIIALCQLKRDSANREPRLEDLRESGSLEQDADIVAFVHRRAFYQANYDSLPYHEQFIVDFIIRKHRGGKLGSPRFFMDVEKSRTYDLQ